MKHWHWISLAFLAVILAVVATTVPKFSGDTGPAVAQQGLELALDMDTTDAGPCADIDDLGIHNVGDSYEVAICIDGLQQAVGAFSVAVLYDDTLNYAPETSCPTGDCLDDNPDANEDEYGDGLGGGWDCNIVDVAEPMGDREPTTGPDNGEAFIGCWSLQGPFTLGDNESSGVLAIIDFQAIGGGADTMSFVPGSNVGDESGAELGSCPPGGDIPMTCSGGADDKIGTPPATSTPTGTATPTRTPVQGTLTPTREAWTKTPTPTEVPTEEPTPPPEEPTQPPPPPPPPPPPGAEELPQVVPPPTGSGPADGIAWATITGWLMAGMGAVSVAIGGLYVRYARHQ